MTHLGLDKRVFVVLAASLSQLHLQHKRTSRSRAAWQADSLVRIVHFPVVQLFDKLCLADEVHQGQTEPRICCCPKNKKKKVFEIHSFNGDWSERISL